MTREEMSSACRELITLLNNEYSILIFTRSDDNSECFTMGNACIRCVLDELAAFVVENEIPHREDETSGTVN